MRKLLLLLLTFCFTGYFFAQKPAEEQTKTLRKIAATANNNSIHLLDSIYVYNNSGTVTAKQYCYYNDDNLNDCNILIDINIWNDNTELFSLKDSTYYDVDGNISIYKTFSYEAAEWLPNAHIIYTRNSSGKADKKEEYRYDIDIEKWVLYLTEDYTYDTENNLIQYVRHTNDIYGDFGPSTKVVYSDFVAEDKPEKGLHYTYNANEEDFVPASHIYYTYDERNNLIGEKHTNIESEGERNTALNEWKYNSLDQISEYLNFIPQWPDYIEFVPSSKTENFYDANNNLVRDRNSWYSSYSGTWNLSTEIHYFWNEAALPQPLASISSNWKYWMARERIYGFYKYEVVKDTLITAPLFETGKEITVKASWIEKTLHSSFIGNTQPGNGSTAYMGGFAAYRQGNKSYVWDRNTRQWFKWIDMDAKPGDSWVIPEIISGKGVHDYVEVSSVTTIEVNGQTIPYIYLIPACESRYNNSRDFTSRLNMSGYWNLDYWALNASPEPQPNGVIYTNNGTPEESIAGLICAKVNNVDFVTNQLEEYVYYNNRNDYDEGIIDCDELKTPYAVPEQRSSIKKYYKPELIKENDHIVNFQRYIAPEIEGSAISTSEIDFRNFTELSPTDIIKIPVVVHIVHNPETPEEKITEQQINKMIQNLNAAYSETHPDRVRDIFKDVIGNPHIEFVLATEDPSGNVSNGIVYYETDKDYFSVSQHPGGIKYRYAFKFNEDGSNRSWDHTKYANIFVADLGGFDAVTNIGGFVTNPEYTTNQEFETYKKWIAEGNPEFWYNWLQSDESASLDGLTVDTWHTFGGVSEINPKANFATAIHELGHYLGLRHVSLTIIQNNDGTFETYDDGFTDTPYTHYNQYTIASCGQDIYQCGNLVQTENYMDYSLECAAMFTVQQADFMRNFLQAVRPDLINAGNAGTNIKDINDNKIVIYPNPAKDYFHIEGTFKNARIMDYTGKTIMSIPANQNIIYLSDFLPGIYLIICESENGHRIVNKIIIEGVN